MGKDLIEFTATDGALLWSAGCSHLMSTLSSTSAIILTAEAWEKLEITKAWFVRLFMNVYCPGSMVYSELQLSCALRQLLYENSSSPRGHLVVEKFYSLRGPLSIAEQIAWKNPQIEVDNIVLI